MFTSRRVATRVASRVYRQPAAVSSCLLSGSSCGFHSTRANWVEAGDAVPAIELMEGSPGNKVNLADELATGKGVIVGTPGAFSPGCTASHVPGYINHPQLKDAGKVFVIAVNDPFVTKAWGKALDPSSSSGIRFLGDTAGKFTSALDLLFDSSAIFGNQRSKRYALLVENGKVKSAFVEPDNTSVNVSAAEKVLG